MAQIVFFQYLEKDSLLHRMDGRLKLLCLLLLSFSVSLAKMPAHYAAAFCLLCAALSAAKLPLAALLREMRLFAFLLAAVFLANAFFTDGDPLPYLACFSIQGTQTGARFAVRLILMIMACTVMTGTTSLLDFRNIIEWYLRPVPFVPEVKAATIVNLTFVLIPVILDSYTEMMDAQKARGIELQKNPVKRVRYMLIPLLGRTLRRADEIVFAMEARCYSQTRTRAVFHTNRADWVLLLACAGVLVFVILT